MDFTLTDDEQLLADTAATILAKECPTSLVRAHLDDRRVATRVWPVLAEWVTLGDEPMVARLLFLRAAGRALVPGPFVPTMAWFVPLLRLAGAPEADAAAAGDLVGTVAMAGASGEWVPNGEPIKTFVAEADLVDVVAVVEPGPRVRLVEVPAERLRPVALLDASRRFFEVDTAGLDGPAYDLDPAALEQWFDQAWVAVAAELVGVARELLERAVAYACERVQFDVPIGSFQAIQHKLADVALEVERAEAATAYAAMAVDAGTADARRAVHVAKAAAGGAATRAAKDSIQTHGGIGYTWEHDLHLFIRRAYADEHLLGTRAWHHERLAELLLDEST